MERNYKQEPKFEITDDFKKRALELLDESQAKQFVEGLRLNSAIASVFGREHERIRLKYGDDHERTKEMKLRVEASAAANTALYMRYTEAATPIAKAGDGWAVDGFVRTANGDPVAGVTVAAYDRQKRWYQDFGYSCTDEKGYFKMLVEKIPDKEMRVYMMASKGEKILKSNENRLAPAAGTANRIEIIIDAGDKGDCAPPPGGDKGETRPPSYEPTVPGKEQPAKDVKDTKQETPSKADPAKGKSVTDTNVGPLGGIVGSASVELPDDKEPDNPRDTNRPVNSPKK